MQPEITATMPLLDQDGRLVQPGWARQPYWQYQRSRIRAPWFRIKEWDYYYVLSKELQTGVSITISDLGYAGLLAVCWLDFETNQYQQCDVLVPFTKSKLGLDEDSSSSKVELNHKRMRLHYEVKQRNRYVRFSAPLMKLANGTGLSGELQFSSGEQDESMNIASGWDEKPAAFYYNRKINCMKVEGHVVLGDADRGEQIQFRPENCYGGLDWGRGNWTYKNRWYWASANGRVDGHDFGMNLGYGFGDRSRASENMVFYAECAYKIDSLVFPFDQHDYLKPWESKSDDGRLRLNFTPILDRHSASNLVIVRSEQHQVFGHFSGKFELDKTRTLEFENILGFAEDVYNRF